MLGNQFGFAGFQYQSSDQVRDELKARLEASPQPMFREPPTLQPAASEPITDVPMYQIDPTVRRAGALLRTRDGREAAVNYGAAS